MALSISKRIFLTHIFCLFPHPFRCTNTSIKTYPTTGGIEKPKHPKSIIGLFRRESSSSTQGAPETVVVSDSEATRDSWSKGEGTSRDIGVRQGPNLLSKRSTSLGGPSVLLMEDVAHSDPLGASTRPASIMQGPHRGQCRRGSMLELTGYVS